MGGMAFLSIMQDCDLNEDTINSEELHFQKEITWESPAFVSMSLMILLSLTKITALRGRHCIKCLQVLAHLSFRESLNYALTIFLILCKRTLRHTEVEQRVQSHKLGKCKQDVHLGHGTVQKDSLPPCYFAVRRHTVGHSLKTILYSNNIQDRRVTVVITAVTW